MRRWISIFLALTLSLFLVSGACTPAAPTAVTAADFYKNNTVTIIVPWSAGGSTDYAARLFASYWSEISGGTMTVKNKTGGTGMVGTNYIYAAEPDGLTIGVQEGPSMLSAALLDNPGVQYDPLEFNYIGLFGRESDVFTIAAGLPYESLEELRNAEGLKLGGISLTGMMAQGGALVAELLQLKDARLVIGYKGGTELGLALGRGEIDCIVFKISSTLEFMEKGFVKSPFFIMDRRGSEAFPDTPILAEVLELSPEQEKLFEAFLTLQTSKIFFAPPGTPEDRVQFLQDAFDQIVTTEGFLKQAGLRWPVWTEPLSGEEAVGQVEEAMGTPSEYRLRLAELVDKYAH